MRQAVLASPSIREWHGERIHAVSPAIGGHPWRIAAGRLDALVFLEANHGGRAVMRPLAAADAFPRLLPQTMLPPAGKAAAVGRLRQLALATPAFLLQVGDLAGAGWHLRHLSRVQAHELPARAAPVMLLESGLERANGQRFAQERSRGQP
jgi:hypothetical protein